MTTIQYITQEELHKDPLTGKVRVIPIWPEDLRSPCKIHADYIRYSSEDLPWPVEIVGYEFLTDSYIVIRTDIEFPGYLIARVNRTALVIARVWQGVKDRARVTRNIWTTWGGI